MLRCDSDRDGTAGTAEDVQPECACGEPATEHRDGRHYCWTCFDQRYRVVYYGPITHRDPGDEDPRQFHYPEPDRTDYLHSRNPDRWQEIR